MNAMTVLFPIFLFVLAWQVYFRLASLFGLWTFVFCLLPTYVLRIGSVSI